MSRTRDRRIPRRRYHRFIVAIPLAIAMMATPAPALAARGHEFGFVAGWGVSDGKPEPEICATKCKAGLPGSNQGQFDVPVAVAVNEASGDFYVLDEANGRVERFDANGKYLGVFDGSGSWEVEGTPEAGRKPSTGKFAKPKSIAVDNSCVQAKLSEPSCHAHDPSSGDVYIADGFEHKVVDKFTPIGEFIEQLEIPLVEGAPFLVLAGVAVDSKGNVWISEEQGLSHRGFDEFDNMVVNQHVNFIGDEELPLRFGLAVGREGELFANTVFESPFNEVIRKFTPGGQVLGVLAREPSTGVAVDPSSGDVFVDDATSVGRFTADLPSLELERFGEGHLMEGQGIGLNSVVVHGQRDREGPIYVADAQAADVAVFPLEEPKPPTIEDVSVSAVTSEGASLQAVVNPRGAKSEYRFEYGACRTPTECASSPFEKDVPAVGAGFVGVAFDFEGHHVGDRPQDLRSGTTYHFRVVARNEKNAPTEAVESKEVVFTTQSTGSLMQLLDGRKWEMVSPAQKHGTLVRQILAGDVIQSAAAGDAFTYVTNSPTEDEPHGFSNLVQVLARRTTAGWMTEDLSLSHSRATGQSIGGGAEYRVFSEDLSLGVVQPFGVFEPATSSEASEQTPYLRTDFRGGDVEAPCISNCYQPLANPGDVQEGASFGEEGSCPPRVICGPVVVGANRTLNDVIVRSGVGLTSLPGDKGGLYEWSGGGLSLVSILPAELGGGPVSLASDPVLGGGGVTRGAVSSNGTHVVWSESAGDGLYSTDVGNRETIEINRGLIGVPTFQAASVDGSRIFFTDGPGRDLYVYEAETGKATKLSDSLEVGEDSEVQGKIAGVSADGSYVYFVADGRLSQEAEPFVHRCDGAGAAIERCYLYVSHAVAGVWNTPHVVAVLSGADFPDFAGNLPKLTVRVSSDGEWLTFMSQLPLTSYDNRDARSGVRDEEVFLYNSTSGKIVCVSCDPSGARPVGIAVGSLENGLVAGDRVWPNEAWLAANVPGWTPYQQGEAFYQSRYLLDDGRVFFNSADALVPRDANGTEDVYEYEPVGVGECTVSSASFIGAEQGCVGLISAGTSSDESAFLDASESGSDVFFLTASRLAASDFDTARDVYDARICSRISLCLREPAPPSMMCASEASCKAPVTLQPEGFGASVSSTFVGLGNVPPPSPPPFTSPQKRRALVKALNSCRREHRHNKRRRVRCEVGARARLAAVGGVGAARGDR